MNIVSMVVILTPSVPPIIRAMFTVPNVALQNTMACRVYRLLKLGIIRDDAVPLALCSGSFELPYVAKRRNTFDGSQARYAGPTDHTDIKTSSTIRTVGQGSKITGMLPMHITINREVEIVNSSADSARVTRLE